jgi:pyrroloquinoline quinone biosynthesis protein B
VRIRVLGAAAGGGYPQWNCACRTCRLARARNAGALPLTHASLALSASGRVWYLVNATPDVRQQIEASSELHPGPAPRHTPIEGVLLTDAELDHTIGLLVLREAARMAVYATGAVLGALERPFPLRGLLRHYAPFEWRPLEPGQSVWLDQGRLRAEAFRTGCKRPRYAGEQDGGDWVVGYRFEDRETRGAVVYAPAVEAWTPELAAACVEADCVLLDGTFWHDDEMRRSGAGARTARGMGHLPIDGQDGSGRRLAALAARHKLYVHVNNTNPMLDRASAESRRLAAQGIGVAADGMELHL